MGSPVSPAAVAADMASPGGVAPELDDAEYLREVLGLAAGLSEKAIDDEFESKANALGIKPPAHTATPEKRNTSSGESPSTVATATHHVRTFSSVSRGSASTSLTARSIMVEGPTTAATPLAPITRRRSKSLSFSHYDKYLQQIDPNINQPKFLKEPSPESLDATAQSLFNLSTRRSLISLRRTLRTRVRWRRGSISHLELPISCICCRDDFSKASALHSLPCGHAYCGDCLRVMINQATTDESKMPPRCCTQPIPGALVKSLLTREEQHEFLKAVLQFSTPWESRIFCPNPACGEFIPPRNKIDPKHPFDATCRKCRHKVCIMCKRDAHPLGQDCPADWELDAVLRMGEKSGWRRCYKCRTLVELTHGCTHMTCRCKAQFCYICGAVWDNMIGCPNFCNGEEEMERRRIEEEARIAEQEAEKAAQEEAAAVEAAENVEAEKRSKASLEFLELRQAQEEEKERFRTYMNKSKWAMWSRQAAKKLATVNKYTDQIEKMKERHAKTSSHLEDRQIAAEMELRATLEQSERSVKIRLRHMEAYCHGLGRTPDSGMPDRVVTEEHLRELGQQYNLRDGIERLHQARINVLRDRQAKRMEELLERQEKEMEKLEDRKESEIEDLAAEFALEEDTLLRVFGERKRRLQHRWGLAVEILRLEMQKSQGVRYAPVDIPEWADDGDLHEDGLAAVPE